METLSVDTGFAQSKWYTGKQQGKFPSALAHPVSVATTGMGAEEKRYTVSGKTYVVGQGALDPLCKQDYTRDISSFIIKVPFLLGKAADEAGIDLASVETLGLGVPINDYQASKTKTEEITSDMSINGIRYNPRVVVTPQGVGALHAFTNEKQINRDEIGLVIDIGGNTCIVIAHKKYKVTSEGSREYTTLGISRAAEILAAQLREIHGLQCSLIETMGIMLSGEIVGPDGKNLNISKNIDEVLTIHVQTIIDTIQSDFGHAIGKYNHLILAGGGATLLNQHLPVQWAKKTIVLDDPEYANARGYYYAAREA